MDTFGFIFMLSFVSLIVGGLSHMMGEMKEHEKWREIEKEYVAELREMEKVIKELKKES